MLGLSESESSTLIAASASLATLVISQWWSRVQARDERASRKGELKLQLDARDKEQVAEQKEWYRRQLFDQRIKAVSEAYNWAMEINRLMNRASDSDAALGNLAETCERARLWYDTNAVYLFDGIPGSSHFLGMVNAAPSVLVPNSSAWQQLNDFLRWLPSRAEEVLDPIKPANGSANG